MVPESYRQDLEGAGDGTACLGSPVVVIAV